LSVAIDEPGIPGMEVTFGVDRFRGGVRTIVVFLEQHGATHEHFTVVGDLDLDTRRRLADRVEFHSPVRLQAHVSAGFRRAVELLQVDAYRAVEAEEIGSYRCARGIGDADPAHP